MKEIKQKTTTFFEINSKKEFILHDPAELARSIVNFLFSRFAIEVLVVGLGILSGMMDDAIPMIRRRIERIEFQWSTAGIDNIMIRPGRDNYCEAGADRRPDAIKNRLTGPLLNAKKLIELVDFRTDLFLGL